MTATFIVILSITTFFVLAFLALLIGAKVRSDSLAGGSYFIFGILAFCIWTIFYTLEFLASTPETKIVMMKLGYLGTVLTLFSFAYISKQGFLNKPFTRSDLTIGLVMSSLLLFFVWVNPGDLYYTSYQILHPYEDEKSIIVSFGHGPVFYFWQTFIIGCIIATCIYIVLKRSNTKAMLRQTALILTAILIPTICSALFICRITVIDWTIPSLSISGLLLYICFLTFGTFDSMTYVRRNFLELLDEIIIVLKPNGTVDFINTAAQRLLRKRQSECVGKTLPQLLPHFSEYDLIDTSFEKSFFFPGETPMDLHFQVSLLTNSRGVEMGKLLIVKDVTELNQVGRKLHYLQSHDEVTGLGNSSMLLEIMNDHAAEHSVGLAGTLLFASRICNANLLSGMLSKEQRIQLDQFVSDYLLEQLPESSTLVRYSQNEFYAFSNSKLLDLSQIRNTLKNACKVDATLGQHSMPVEFKMGAYVIEEDTDAANALLNVAFALNAALDSSSEGVKIYDKSMMLQHNLHRTLLGITHQPNYKRDFFIEFQPIINIRQSRVAGAEIFVRWNHPALGTLSPSSFIPVFETTGHIMDVGSFVLEKAFKTVATWQDQLDSDFFVSINISKNQIENKGTLKEITRLMEKTGVNPKFLNFEIKGSQITESIADAEKFAFAIKELGSMVSIDDFGGVKSSISHITRLGCHQVKLYPDLLTGAADQNKNILLPIIKELCNKLDCQVIGKYVETVIDFNLFKSQGIDFLQGYIFSHPLSEEEFWNYCTSEYSPLKDL